MDIISMFADGILAREKSSPVLVSIDGVDAAGKTVFAGQLASALRERCDRSVVTASVTVPTSSIRGS